MARKSGQSSNLETILVELTPLGDGRETARLLDMGAGRSAEVLRGWLKGRGPCFQEQMQVSNNGRVHWLCHRSRRTTTTGE